MVDPDYCRRKSVAVSQSSSIGEASRAEGGPWKPKARSVHPAEARATQNPDCSRKVRPRLLHRGSKYRAENMVNGLTVAIRGAPLAVVSLISCVIKEL